MRVSGVPVVDVVPVTIMTSMTRKEMARYWQLFVRPHHVLTLQVALTCIVLSAALELDSGVIEQKRNVHRTVGMAMGKLAKGERLAME